MPGHGCASFSAGPEYEQLDGEKAVEEEEEVLEDFPLDPEEEDEQEEAEGTGGELAESGEGDEGEGEGEGKGGDEEDEGGEGGDFFDFSSYDESTEAPSLNSCAPPRLVDAALVFLPEEGGEVRVIIVFFKCPDEAATVAVAVPQPVAIRRSDREEMGRE